jgi:uncharacterized protein (DUF1778 family)
MSKRLITIGVRVSSDERKIIRDLAERLGRTESDAVRSVVLSAASVFLDPDREEKEKTKNEK